MTGSQHTPPEEPGEDWMEIWYETGEITWQKPLSPEAEERLQDVFDDLLREQSEETDCE